VDKNWTLLILNLAYASGSCYSQRISKQQAIVSNTRRFYENENMRLDNKRRNKMKNKEREERNEKK
jgi:hypothetical protein